MNKTNSNSYTAFAAYQIESPNDHHLFIEGGGTG